jgi:predicted O-methyltransferase YrrM
MSKINKLLRIAAALMRQPSLLNRVLEDDAPWARYVLKKYKLEYGLPAVSLTDLFGPFQQTLETVAFLDGSSLPTDVALLKNLAQSVSGCRYFEIGTWRGESVANVADSAATCYTLDLPAADLQARGLPQEYISQQGFFSLGRPNIIHLKGNSASFDFASLGLKFDLVFIDGDHHYESVRSDTSKVFADLIHPGSIVVWHDYAFNPERIRHEVLAGILDGTPPEKHRELYFVSNTLCALYIQRAVPSSRFISPANPAHRFRVTIGIKS